MIVTRGYGAGGSTILEYKGGAIDVGIFDIVDMSIAVGADTIAVSVDISTTDDVTVTVL